MKLGIVSIFLLLILTAPAFAIDINGIWNGGNSTFIFFQEGQKVKVLCSYKWENRQPIVWYGEGTIKGSRVQYKLHHTSNLAPAGWEDGIHEYSVASDGNSMNGTWKTVSGSASGQMPQLTKTGP